MEEREFRRFNSIHLVHYSLYDEDLKNCGEGVARTLNISEGGALIEITSLPDDMINTVKMGIALGDILLILQGRVAFINKVTVDTTEMGIQFFGLTSELKKQLSDFLKIFVSEREKNKNLIRGKNSNVDQSAIDKINSLMQLIKEHSRNEMVNLFPAIDSDRSKIRVLNKLLTGIR